MIIFKNPGLIPIEAITTMGVSVKSEGAIGYFGTGAKFAIATVLRLGGSVTIWRGMVPYHFTTREMTVTNGDLSETFEQVCMNGEPLGFTTQLGRNWEAWMAWREFASNCRDAGGDYWAEIPDMPSLVVEAEGFTTVLVDCEALQDAHKDRRTIMLEGDPIFTSEHVDIYPGTGSDFVYYRGVRIHRPIRPTALVYNVKRKLDLTEDRTALWDFQVHAAIRSGIAACKDKALLRAALDCGEGYLEHHLSFDSFTERSEEFVALGAELAMGAGSNPKANPSVVNGARAEQLRAMKPGDGMTLNSVQQAMLNRATSMLIEAGFAIDDFPLVIADTLGTGIHGLAKDGKIFISALAFSKGTRELAATLLEEFAHLKSGQTDCSRGFQNWIFDQLLCRVETQHGEPF